MVRVPAMFLGLERDTSYDSLPHGRQIVVVIRTYYPYPPLWGLTGNVPSLMIHPTLIPRTTTSKTQSIPIVYKTNHVNILPFLSFPLGYSLEPPHSMWHIPRINWGKTTTKMITDSSTDIRVSHVDKYMVWKIWCEDTNMGRRGIVLGKPRQWSTKR